MSNERYIYIYKDIHFQIYYNYKKIMKNCEFEHFLSFVTYNSYNIKYFFIL